MHSTLVLILGHAMSVFLGFSIVYVGHQTGALDAALLPFLHTHDTPASSPSSGSTINKSHTRSRTPTRTPTTPRPVPEPQQLQLVIDLPLFLDNITALVAHNVFRPNYVYDGSPTTFEHDDFIQSLYAEFDDLRSGGGHGVHKDNEEQQQQSPPVKDKENNTHMPRSIPPQRFKDPYRLCPLNVNLARDIDHAVCASLINYIQLPGHFVESASSEAEDIVARLLWHCEHVAEVLPRAYSSVFRLETARHRLCRITTARANLVNAMLQKLLLNVTTLPHWGHDSHDIRICHLSSLEHVLKDIHSIFFSTTAAAAGAAAAAKNRFPNGEWRGLLRWIKFYYTIKNNNPPRLDEYDLDLDLGGVRRLLQSLGADLTSVVTPLDNILIPLATAYLAGHIEAEVPWLRTIQENKSRSWFSPLRALFFSSWSSLNRSIQKSRYTSVVGSRDPDISWEQYRTNSRFHAFKHYYNNITDLQRAMVHLTAPDSELTRTRVLLRTVSHANTQQRALEEQRQQIGKELASMMDRGWVHPSGADLKIDDLEAFVQAFNHSATMLAEKCEETHRWEYFLWRKYHFLKETGLWGEKIVYEGQGEV